MVARLDKWQKLCPSHLVSLLAVPCFKHERSKHTITHQPGISVMGVFPIAMNILQFWLLDSIVKFKATFAGFDTGPEDQERLVSEQFDDEDDFDAPNGDSSSMHAEVERRPPPSFSSESSTLPINLHANDNDAASSPPTSTSSRTIIPRRQSPPPSPSQKVTPSSSYGSIGDDAAVRTSRERYRYVEDDDDEHTKWSKGLGFERSEYSWPVAPDTAGEIGRPISNSPTSQKQWESWRMPKISLPRKGEPLR